MFSLDRNSVSSLKFQALNADKGHTLQTLKNDTAMSSLGLILRLERLFFSKVNRKWSQELKSGEYSGLWSCTSFRFQGIVNKFTTVGTCIVMNRGLAS